MILSDDREMRLLFELIFEKEGYECILAETSTEALSHLQALDIDFGFFDLSLPNESESGWDFYLQLKGDPNLSKIPIIIYTASRNEKLPNPDDYGDALFTKPLQIKDMLARIEEVLKKD
ncbi:MAG: response regulator [Chloroflexota bacterium]